MSAQVRPGYKLTEVGVIPEDWECLQISEIFQFKQGIQCSVEKQTESETPKNKRFIRIVDVTDGSQAPRFIDDPGSNHHIYKDDIFMVRYGSPGLICHGYEGVIANNLFRLIPKASMSKDFYFHYFGSIEDKIKDISGSSTMPAISFKTLGLLSVVLPSLLDQEVIAAALTDIDALISGLDQLIAKKRDIKQATMQQLLTGQQRLPGFAPPMQLFKNTQVGRMPEDWEIARLGDLVDPSRSIRYGIVQPGRYDPQGRYMLRGQDYSEAKGWANPSDVFRVSPEVEERYRNARVKNGDLIMTIVGYCGHVEIIPAWLDGANLTQTTVRIAIEPGKAISAYCKYVLLDSTGKNQVAAYMKGAAQPGLNCGDIEQFLVPMPTIPEQAAIATILFDMDSELATLETRRNKARQLKQGMMQELLTGRIRLVSPGEGPLHAE
jgi:type I restriction enzyme S subunit